MIEGLRAALEAARSPWAGAPLEVMADKGLAHHHVRLGGSGLLARVPKQSQMGLGAAEHLAYEAACFERASASGHAPRCHARLAPQPGLARGALIVDEIVGRPARLPADLPAIADALAAIHALALPPPALRAPLLDAPDPLAALLAEITVQARHLGAAALDPAVAALIADEIERLDALCAHRDRPPRRLIVFDAHPGNFLIRADGGAVLVDLEKARYGYAALDLAHATLYTSTTWDLESRAELGAAEVAAAYFSWEKRCGSAERRWYLPLRAAMWLWSLSWCAKWRATSARAARRDAAGEDWSRQLHEDALVAHVRDRVDCYLALPAIEFVRAEFAELKALFGV